MGPLSDLVTYNETACDRHMFSKKCTKSTRAAVNDTSSFALDRAVEISLTDRYYCRELPTLTLPKHQAQ